MTPKNGVLNTNQFTVRVNTLFNVYLGSGNGSDRFFCFQTQITQIPLNKLLYTCILKSVRKLLIFSVSKAETESIIH